MGSVELVSLCREELAGPRSNLRLLAIVDYRLSFRSPVLKATGWVALCQNLVFGIVYSVEELLLHWFPLMHKVCACLRDFPWSVCGFHNVVMELVSEIV